MVKHQTEKGQITVNSGVINSIVGMAASNCFGVKGMAVRSMTDGLVHLLRIFVVGRSRALVRIVRSNIGNAYVREPEIGSH